jgi:hypothetical protein
MILFKTMKNESLEGLNLEERRLNLAYQVVHRFRPNAKRILALPDLLDIMASPPLLRHMTQLWYSDAVAAAGAEAAATAAEAAAATIEKALVDNALYMEARDFWQAQAIAWEKAAKEAEASLRALKAQGSNG